MEFCLVKVFTFESDGCFSLDSSQVVGMGGAFVDQRYLYFSLRNYSASFQGPWHTNAIDVVDPLNSWKRDFSTCTNQIPPETFTSYSPLFDKVIVQMDDFSNTELYLLNDTMCDSFSSGETGTVSTYLASSNQFWVIAEESLYSTNLISRDVTRYKNVWNFVQIAASQHTDVIYGLAPAAGSTLLYSLDTSLIEYTFIGDITNCQAVNGSTAVIDYNEMYVSFVCLNSQSAPYAVTLSVYDASLVSYTLVEDAGLQFIQSLV
jgi:hypothetical protein